VLIDDFLPHWHVGSHHELLIHASPQRAYTAIWETDFASSFVVRTLLTLRAVPARFSQPKALPSSSRRLTLRDVLQHGFCLLAEDPGRELVLGVTGRFWQLSGNLEHSEPSEFRRPLPPGIARAAWSFVVSERGSATSLVATETRVACGDEASLRRFHRYWSVVGPFSGFIRTRMLKAIRATAERT
jgi:hypothetical protein